MLRLDTNKNTKFRRPYLILSLAVMLGLSAAQAQTIDYDLNQATRTIRDVGNGLERLRPGDVATYNRLSAKLTKAGKHLENTQSSSHPDYAAAVQRWGELQALMAAIAQEWQAAQREAAAPQQAQPAAAGRQQAPPQAKPAPAPAPAAQSVPAAAKTRVEPVDLDPLMNKYQRGNLPKFPDAATPDQARTWALHMKGLQTTTLQADLASIESALSSGAATQADADRVRRWISDMFQNNIKQTVQQQVQANEGIIAGMIYSADLINGVADGDMNGAYRFAGGDKLQNNAARLDNALRAGTVAAVFDEVFGTSNPVRADQLGKIQAARARLDELAPLAAEQAEVFANAPKKKRPVTKDFLAPIAQEYWLNGSVMAESDDDGGIWINSNNVGDITHNGKIWVQANERGSIEPNGKVWFDGNHVGSLEPNGEIWRSGNQVGLIGQDGKVWINGSADGEIVPFQGEWKRAAVLYYFGEFFAE